MAFPTAPTYLLYVASTIDFDPAEVQVSVHSNLDRITGIGPASGMRYHAPGEAINPIYRPDPALGAGHPIAGAAESGTGRIRDILIAYVRKAFYDVRRASSLRRTRRAPRHIGALRPAEVLRSTRNVIRRRRLASMEIIRSLPAAGTT